MVLIAHHTGLAKAPSMATLAILSSALKDLRISQQSLPAISHMSKRNASHQAQGRANKAKDGPGKRLGAKKTGGEYVVPGNIIFKQRGTLWFPGDNCFMGRDHTIHAGAPGYVTYYKDPARHPDRKYIGIVFEKGHSLPQPAHAVRRRKLGMLAYQTPPPTQPIDQVFDALGPTPSISQLSPVAVKKNSRGSTLALRPGYQYRQANWEIGREAEKREAAMQEQGKTTRMFPVFKPKNRFAAWRKSAARISKNAETRARNRMGKAKK
ncbi:Hypothetical protein R9X50_00681600 [Acrodontium crateriforme]|uniref:Large ribosomal subunit protein bL27m n=1 Tax=Acrodontium crateriforme TaxID=150365 RepID=A0AAQ3MAS4_9PEZI|nr:Hypothetical protein R9X50_00681600 [Acrodontium crateriforme]